MKQFVAAVPRREGWLAEVLPDLRDTLGDAQVWQSSEVALLVAPLAALRHETPTRPVVLDGGRYALAGYVRLDDRARLLRRLHGDVRNLPDEALVVRGWAEHGESVLDALVGVFAFLLWDAHLRQLFCVRDHVGLQPLYWAAVPGGGVVAGSSPELLACVPGVDRELDVEAVVAGFLGYPPLQRVRTPLRGVAKVPQGGLARIASGQVGRVTVRDYWTPVVSPSADSEADVIAQLRDLLVTVVDSATESAGTVGTHLSGGLDSSAVTVLASQTLGRGSQELRACFSWSPSVDALPDLGVDDERRRIDLVAERLGVPVIYSALDEGELTSTMRDGLSLSQAAGLFHEPSVTRAARERGIATLLSGWGGDEFASWNGRGALSGLLRAGRFGRAAGGAFRRTGPTGSMPRRLFRTGRTLQQAVRPLLPVRLQPPTGKQSLYSRLDPDTLGRLAALDPGVPAVMEQVRLERVRFVGAAYSQLWLLRHGHLSLRAEAWSHAGAAEGIEYRYPLLDRRVVEWALTVPDEVHAAVPRSRHLFREAVSGLLPAEVWDGPAKKEPAKLRYQSGLVSAVQVVAPEGSGLSSALLEGWFDMRREIHNLLKT